MVIRVLSSSHGPGMFPLHQIKMSGRLFDFVFKGLQNLLDRIERMRALGPEFIDITWCVSSLATSSQKS